MGNVNPLWVLLHSWSGNTINRRFVADVIVNVSLYVPLGMAGHLAFRASPSQPGHVSKLSSVFAPIGIGMLLSACLEMIQILVPGRYCSAIDWTNNVIGSALGVAAAIVFERLAGSRRIGRLPHAITDRSALALICCWVISMLFPLSPVTGLFVFRQKLDGLEHGPWFQFLPWVSAVLSWFAAGRLLRAIQLSSRWLWLSVLLVPAQFFIATRQPQPSEMLGAICGAIVFSFRGRSSRAQSPAAWAFFSLLILRGLAPFHFMSATQAFSWIPFGGFLATDWQPGLLILLEKTFYYGTAIWLLRDAGMRLRNATLLVAAALGLIESAQTHLAGRTSEITDPIMALLIGAALGVLGRGNEKVPARG